MSIHRSLRGVNTLMGDRSVLTRFERIQKMIKDGKLAPESASPYGLPKMRTRFKVVSGKRAKEIAADAAPAAKDAKPAAGKAPAAAGKAAAPAAPAAKPAKK